LQSKHLFSECYEAILPSSFDNSLPNPEYTLPIDLCQFKYDLILNFIETGSFSINKIGKIEYYVFQTTTTILDINLSGPYR